MVPGYSGESSVNETGFRFVDDPGSTDENPMVSVGAVRVTATNAEKMQQASRVAERGRIMALCLAPRGRRLRGQREG